MNDKYIEKKRYNEHSNFILRSTDSREKLQILGALNFPLPLRPPYHRYENLIIQISLSNNNIKQLDLCCGNGLHSFTLFCKTPIINFNHNVIALDYSEKSIEIAKIRNKLTGYNVDFRVCDVEKLPFKNSSFDLITCAGSLSYVNHEIFIKECKRVLKPGGAFICVDSFNHNVFYRLNRYIHYIRKKRTKSTLNRMPDVKLINLFRTKFKTVNVEYFGIFVFILPILMPIFGKNKSTYILNKLDHIFTFFKKYSFKIVIHAINH